MNKSNRKIRMGMVGGGKGAFIGAIHRMAAALDGQIELVCGAFSADPEVSVASGQLLQVTAERCYPDFKTMMRTEGGLPESLRMEFVVIVTPNHLHFRVAKEALEFGFHVLSDKPAAFNLKEAYALRDVIKESGRLYGLTYTYSGYPLVKHARHLVETGLLGNIRKIIVEYSQDWLACRQELNGKQAAWRLDPKRVGSSCCFGDIGVHAAHLLEYVSGLQITQLCADLNSVVDGRELDDDATLLLRFGEQAKGILIASQIAIGEENNLRLRIYGDKASIDWSQMEPNSLWLKHSSAPAQLIRAGRGELSSDAQKATRLPAGHPEGYIEAFANIYQNFALQIMAFESGEVASNQLFDVPGIDDAMRGMAFIESAVKANQSDTKWHDFCVD